MRALALLNEFQLGSSQRNPLPKKQGPRHAFMCPHRKHKKQGPRHASCAPIERVNRLTSHDCCRVCYSQVWYQRHSGAVQQRGVLGWLSLHTRTYKLTCLNCCTHSKTHAYAHTRICTHTHSHSQIVAGMLRGLFKLDLGVLTSWGEMVTEFYRAPARHVLNCVCLCVCDVYMYFMYTCASQARGEWCVFVCVMYI